MGIVSLCYRYNALVITSEIIYKIDKIIISSYDFLDYHSSITHFERTIQAAIV